MFSWGGSEKTLKNNLLRKLLILSSIFFTAMIAILIFQYQLGIDEEMIIVSKLDAKVMQRQFDSDPNKEVFQLSTTYGYRSWETIPQPIRDAVNYDLDIASDQLIEGHFDKAGQEYYFSIFTYFEEDGSKLYLVDQYPAKELDIMVDEYINKVLRYSFWTLFSFIVLLLSLTVLWMRQLGLPFAKMQRWAGKLGKGDVEPRQSYKFKEFNQLAEQLEAAMERVSAFNKREQQFLKHASHEFRTPVAIVQATLDTLQEQYQEDKRLMRIRHAMNNMQTTSTTLLWLARESKVKEDTQLVNLITECETIVTNLNYLKQSKSVSVNICGQGSINEQASLIRITLENLIRNAYQHSSEGIINIRVSSGNLSVTNPYEHHGTTQGFGFGLELVERISDKQNWKFDVSKSNNEFSAYLCFIKE
ncbi:hypothetical protein TW85_23820 [Marinomonas sp. S3726]|uniref:sensor histidine kinase n=1 Tax=Marinomonas sp. S3726 TaxID=579484 RepID=UPI0005FA5D0C|nr:HAMP domain-containing sensor histidine kinase [Marinomonas sp. S3726]KJZ08486.1 hypothetical protein TW85_23820 [Marinomonas sp. S3726]